MGQSITIASKCTGKCHTRVTAIVGMVSLKPHNPGKVPTNWAKNCSFPETIFWQNCSQNGTHTPLWQGTSQEVARHEWYTSGTNNEMGIFYIVIPPLTTTLTVVAYMAFSVTIHTTLIDQAHKKLCTKGSLGPAEGLTPYVRHWKQAPRFFCYIPPTGATSPMENAHSKHHSSFLETTETI